MAQSNLFYLHLLKLLLLLLLYAEFHFLWEIHKFRRKNL